MERTIEASSAEERFRATLSTAFAGSALALAAIGLYGVATRRAGDRRREFGVRIALGARPVDLSTLVLRDALLLVACGLAVGLPAAYAASQSAHSLLYGVSPAAVHVFVLTSSVLALTATAAVLGPARRAGNLDPMTALRD
jgi:ABC-type antimicrobial peptide transport system permease subunit